MSAYLRQRHAYLLKCWKHSKQHTITAVVMLVAGIWSAVSTYGAFFNLPTRYVATLPKLPVTWAVMIFLAGLVFILIEGGYRVLTTSQKQFEAIRRKISDTDAWREQASRFQRWSISG